MVDVTKLGQGVEVYGDNNQLFGTIERVSGNDIYISGKRFPISSFSRFEQNRLYLGSQQQNGAAFQQGEDAIKVPVIEEQLKVGKRQVELGEVELQKTVTQEQVSVPVELRREEVHVQEVDIADRPLQAGEDAFQEGTIRVPVRGEEAVVNKQAVVTGEVVINKGVTTEQQQISDTVRKEDVTVDKNYTQAQSRPVATQPVPSQVESYVQEQANTAQVAATPTTTTTDAGMSTFDQSQIEEDMEVYSSDNHHLGKVKEATSAYFLVGRGLFKGTIEANYASVRGVSADGVILNLTKDQVDALT